jgi:hypothetical protein
MRSHGARFILKQKLPRFLPVFQLPGRDEFITVCNFLAFDFTAQFYRKLRPQVVRISLQTVGISKKPTSQDMAKPCEGKWGASN